MSKALGEALKLVSKIDTGICIRLLFLLGFSNGGLSRLPVFPWPLKRHLHRLGLSHVLYAGWIVGRKVVNSSIAQTVTHSLQRYKITSRKIFLSWT